MWTVACGTLLLGYTFWGLFPTLEEAREYAETITEEERFLVRIHAIPEELKE